MARRLLRARDFQARNAPVRRVANAGRPALRRALHEALLLLGDRLVPVEEIERKLAAGLLFQAKEVIRWDAFRDVLKVPFERIGRIMEAGASLGERKVNGLFAASGRRVRMQKAIGDRFAFDRFDWATQERIRRYQDRFITRLSDDARDSIDRIVYRSAMAGFGPERIAGEIRRFIGLNDRQAEAAVNYHRMLMELDPAALTRAWRNPAYDEALRSAIEDAQDLSDAAVDRMVKDYASNALDSRAATIAQTEATRAANEGLHSAYRQAIDRGAFPSDAVRRYWQVALDEKLCDICRGIPQANPAGVAVDEPFESEDGPVADPPIHPNCRCSVEYVTDLEKVPDDES